jgi:flagellar basal body P-ring protein FlgI
VAARTEDTTTDGGGDNLTALTAVTVVVGLADTATEMVRAQARQQCARFQLAEHLVQQQAGQQCGQRSTAAVMLEAQRNVAQLRSLTAYRLTMLSFLIVVLVAHHTRSPG